MKTEYLLEKEVQQVLDLLTYENRLVMRTALHTGLRISDVLQLRPEQLKPNFWVTEQKTGKRGGTGCFRAISPGNTGQGKPSGRT